MQHFGLPTRLLDVTTNALVALYFACQSHLDSEGYETDGIVTMFISNKTQNIDNYTYYSSRSDTVEVLSTLALMDEVKKKAIYDSDKKVSLHNVEDEPIRLVISGVNKQKILKELDQSFEINQATLFPDKENVASYIKIIFNKECLTASRVYPN
ncbi:FRG domain-containing protein, partial [Lactobacillus helveticus]|uniref:FRG domain-containing protein n=1 Tax=Lactobacillus helveticus TaxID=1587 RepID=UPI0020B6E413